MNLLTKIRGGAKKHSSVILAVGAGAGVLTTAYLSARAGYQTAQALENEDPHANNAARARLVWRLYIPAGLSAAVTVVCIAGSKRVDGAKSLAAQTALAVSQQAYSEYRDQVVAEFGDRKDKAIAARVAESRVTERPPVAIVAGSGEVICCELFTGRYFQSDMQALAKAVNEINAKLNRHDYATLDDFYYEVGLEFTKVSGHTGWDSSKLLELEFSSILHDGKPVLAFDYNYVKGL